MPTFSPTILPGPPDVQATMAGGITYEEFIFMLGILNLHVRSFFLETGEGAQIDANLAYQIIDASGIANQNTMKPRKDPYQRENSLNFVPQGPDPVVLNGLSNVTFTLLAQQLLTMTLEVNEVEPRTLAPGRLKDNFASIPDPYGNFARFKRRLLLGK